MLALWPCQHTPHVCWQIINKPFFYIAPIFYQPQIKIAFWQLKQGREMKGPVVKQFLRFANSWALTTSRSSSESMQLGLHYESRIVSAHPFPEPASHEMCSANARAVGNCLASLVLDFCSQCVFEVCCLGLLCVWRHAPRGTASPAMMPPPPGQRL